MPIAVLIGSVCLPIGCKHVFTFPDRETYQDAFGCRLEKSGQCPLDTAHFFTDATRSQ
ncbi:MAG: hypothetical protein KME16_02325 [Scytolyngbya sp. HA4215-MV1]|nr:hypothetical protein [Scytolyngbya sp. HA4215-MV1]